MSDLRKAVEARDEVDNIATALRVLLDALAVGRPEQIAEAKAGSWAALRRALSVQADWDAEDVDDAPAWMEGL